MKPRLTSLAFSLLLLAGGACSAPPAAPPPALPEAPKLTPCERLVACCKSINRDDLKAQVECEEYLRESAGRCVGLFQLARRSYEGVLPVSCR